MNKSSESKPNFPFYTSFRHGSMKCFSIDISDKNMPGVSKYTTEVLKLEWKNVNLLSSSMPGYFMHYPGQLYRSYPLVSEYIENTGFFTGELSAKNFWIDSVEVVKRRNTLKSECLEDSEKDQEYIISMLFEKTQCKPPNWKDAKYPTCNSKILKGVNISFFITLFFIFIKPWFYSEPTIFLVPDSCLPSCMSNMISKLYFELCLFKCTQLLSLKRILKESSLYGSCVP